MIVVDPVRTRPRPRWPFWYYYDQPQEPNPGPTNPPAPDVVWPFESDNNQQETGLGWWPSAHQQAQADFDAADSSNPRGSCSKSIFTV